MMDKKIKEMLDSMPDIIESGIVMNKPNDPVRIYEGKFLLKNANHEFEITGKIQFEWFPKYGVIFSGEAPNQWLLLMVRFSEDYVIEIDNEILGSCFLTHLSGRVVRGIMGGNLIRGDKSVPVNSIKFSLPNFTDFWGAGVKKRTGSRVTTSVSRINLDNDEFVIILDKCIDFGERNGQLKDSGGYFLLYSGLITSRKGILNFKKAQNVLNCLSFFLSFVNGRRVSPLFAEGICDGKVIWTDYNSSRVDRYTNILRWPNTHRVEYLNDLWKNFSSLWKQKETMEVLSTTIDWYIEANLNLGFIEGSIVMAQTGLELLYNWHIIENLKLIVGKDADTISSANKIRLLLALLGISHVIPEGLSNLRLLEKFADGPEAFTQIRNAIVHSKDEKRKMLKDIPNITKHEALQLGLWYIELSLLKILNFNGEYFNRCWLRPNSPVETVPWANTQPLNNPHTPP